MKVIGIVAGPRRTGSTARLVEEILAGAKGSGHETHVFYMGEMDIKPLEADEHDYVYPDDDFTKLMPHLESMDALVLGSPIYYDHVSARAKILIDRLYYYSTSHGAEYRKLIKDGIKFIGVLSCGWDNPNVYGEVVTWLEERMSHYWNMEPVGSVKAYGTGSKPASQNKELLKKARALGESLV
ncbi:MAG: flavodoxin family protein [Candidatus Bathyarchaeota archaeon]|nr:flavodoxin family protein [Candidatus Bathyarchaeota archaeon]